MTGMLTGIGGNIDTSSGDRDCTCELPFTDKCGPWSPGNGKGATSSCSNADCTITCVFL